MILNLEAAVILLRLLVRLLWQRVCISQPPVFQTTAIAVVVAGPIRDL